MIALADQDVLRLHVSVDQPHRVRRVECVGYLGEQPDAARGIELACADLILERGTLDDAHGDVEALLGLACLVHGGDVGVVDRGLNRALPPKALPELGIAAQLAWQELQRDGAVEGQLRGSVDRAHAAHAQNALDPVAGNDGSRLEHHSASLRRK